MSPAVIPAIVPVDADLTHPDATATSSTAARSSQRKSRPKMGAGSAWAAWTATGSASAGSDFLQSISAWVEGTTAQLLRRPWPTGAGRMTSAEVQERLRHHLAVVARDQRVTYLEALGLARRGVIEELRTAARLWRETG